MRAVPPIVPCVILRRIALPNVKIAVIDAIFFESRLAGLKNSCTFASAIDAITIAKHGSLDEWLSQRSAKPCTAVRIRQEPLKTLVTN